MIIIKIMIMMLMTWISVIITMKISMLMKITIVYYDDNSNNNNNSSIIIITVMTVVDIPNNSGKNENFSNTVTT